MIAIDLFAGAGGMSLGLSQAGFDVRAAIEYEKSTSATYMRNHAHTKMMRESIVCLKTGEFLERAELKKNDIKLIAGGLPGSGFSRENGHSRNFKNPYEDKKNRLVFEFIRYVNDIQPDAFIMENVQGFLSLQKKFNPPLIDRFIQLGYANTNAYILNAQDFGVPQKRKRVYVIGTKNEDIIFNFEQYKIASCPRTVQEALFGDLPVIHPGTKGYTDPVGYLDNAPETDYQKYLRGSSKCVYNHVTTVSNPTVIERFAKIAQGKNGVSLGDEMGISIQFSNSYKRLRADEPAFCLCNFRKSLIMPPHGDRILSVREAARLQSFPDWYLFEGGISSMQQQVGEATPPLLAKFIAIELIHALSIPPGRLSDYP